MESISIQYATLVHVSLTQSPYLQLVSENSQLSAAPHRVCGHRRGKGRAGENKAFWEMRGRKSWGMERSEGWCLRGLL